MSEFILSLEPEYIRDLAAIWLDSPDPASVSQAGNTVDKLLKSNPAKNGQYLSEGMYQLIVPPLAVYWRLRGALEFRVPFW